MKSNIQSVQLIAIKRGSISVSLNEGGPITFDLNGGSTVGSTTPSWKTNWNLAPGQETTAVQVCVYLSGPLMGLGPAGAAIPPSQVEAKTNSSRSFRSLAGTACGQPNGLQVALVPVTDATRRRGSQNDSLVLRVNELGLNLPPDTYTGTLNIMAEVTEGAP